MNDRQTPLALIFAIVFMVPLYFHFYIVGQYDLGKIIALYGLTGIMVPFVLYQYKQFSLYLTQPLIISILLFVFISFLSAVFSIDPIMSVFGYVRRYDGLLSLCVYVFIFFTVINYVDVDVVGVLCDVIIITGCIASVYGILQYFDIDLYYQATDFGCGGRVMSTFGHPGFFAGFLVMVIPLALSRLVYGWGWVYAVALVLMIAALYMTKARAGIVGFGVSTIFFFVVGRKYYYLKRLEFITGIVIVVVLTIVFNVSKENTILSRFKQDIKTTKNGLETAGTAAIRLFNCSTGIAIIKDSPIIGNGQDTLSNIFLKYVASSYLGVETSVVKATQLSATYKGERRYFYNQSRIHQDFIDMAVTRGLLGVAAYLFMICAFTVMVWKKCKQGDLLTIGIVSGLIASFVQRQFLFFHIADAMLYWVMLGLAFVICRKDVQYAKS